MHALSIALLLSFSLHAASYDILIKNARILNGSGSPATPGDIAISNGRIAAVGSLPEATAARIIDARGRIAAPGFIDVHTHIEGGIETVPRADNFLLDGVTTVVTGNCGSSELPLAPWFAALEKTGIGINVASLVGHNAVRRAIMGSANRKATPDEIAAMQALIDTAMKDGAAGFSTGLIYIPGAYSDTREVVSLARTAAGRGGVYASHMRDEGADILPAVTEAATVGLETGARVQLSHFKIDNRRVWGLSEKALALVEDFRGKGVDISIDQYPYNRSSTGLGITMNPWVLADGDAQIQARIDDPATRAKIIAEMKQLLDDRGLTDYAYAMVARYSPDRAFEGKSIPEIVSLTGKEPTLDNQIAQILQMMHDGGAQMVYHEMGEADIERIAKWKDTAVASDGGVRQYDSGVPHPRSYGTNARVLAEHVRKQNWLTLEDAVRRMTSLPARIFNFKDRGLIREGLAADILIFDPAKVQDRATFATPHQYSEGFDYVLVNGQIAVQGGQLMETRAGQILRGPAAP